MADRHSYHREMKISFISEKTPTQLNHRRIILLKRVYYRKPLAPPAALTRRRPPRLEHVFRLACKFDAEASLRPAGRKSRK
ncbi:Uncharacterized protein DAT39_021459 [Clarias magur]|uniref:Uncharacterized protein n=1 Tax=Clarias magur TaxID=1594786 RepID=A0A8J4T460_CLAMG|nr:Uncharacterized protein DAT39_021459 [Clarias magur]